MDRNIKDRLEKSVNDFMNNPKYSYNVVNDDTPNRFPNEITGLCTNCNLHKATTYWTGDRSAIDISHGHYTIWCECCALKTQIEHMKKLANKLAETEDRLRNVVCK